MISKSQQNMVVLDDDSKVLPNHMNEMPKNLSLDKINCDNASSQSPQMENEKDLADHSNEKIKTRNMLASEDVEMKTNEFQSETRLQLSFSVDRLLSGKSSKSRQHLETDVGERLSEKCYGELNTSYACCSLPNCLVSTTTSSTTTCSANSNQDNDEEIISSPAFNFMDFKSVVRPTPVRALSNASEPVLPLTHLSSLPPTSMIRFHHAYLQQQQKQPPPQHLPTQQNFSLSSLMSPQCGLKSLQLSAHQMGLQNFATAPANRFSTKVNFDLPIVRPNLACISTLRHHHLGTTSSSEAISHLNFNTSTATAAPAHAATANASSGNSAATISSGKRKRSWSRAVFSNLQRKGLEIQFQQQKYITKPDRRKLAARLNLTDAQVKVWFQNRRMKWRHTRENLKSGQEKQPGDSAATDTLEVTAADSAAGIDLPGYSSDGSSSLEMSDADEDDDEIDVVE